LVSGAAILRRQNPTGSEALAEQVLAEHELRINGVELFEESYQTYRELNDGDPKRYPVMLCLSRPVDDYERTSLADTDIQIDDDDPMTAAVFDTTLEEIRDRLEELNGALATAAGNARNARQSAEAEDERLRTLAKEIDAALKQ
jgi:hypothetical protein